MKKTILLSAVALAASASVFAQSAEELRVYINPGHGSWTGGDRAMQVIGHQPYDRYNTDTTNFFESNTNLRKGFGVLEKLRAMGLQYDPTLNQTGERWQIGAARDMSNNIVMSHVKCGPYHDDNGTKNQLGDKAPADLEYYNRSLLEICREVDANNFDMFISIHSNAATEGTVSNYPLYIYRGYDSPKQETGLDLSIQYTSREMSQKSWPYAFENPHSTWSHYSMTNPNIRGDIDFYHGYTVTDGNKGYLGVLRHNTPGFLVEGYFHTYQPARHRAMNFDVDYLEGAAYAHGIADYFEIEKEKVGDIYGIARSSEEKFRHALYTPSSGTDDCYRPLNGLKVLLQKDGVTVAECTTDENYNGAFIFKNVEPGEYTIAFDSEQYKTKPEDGPLTVTVEAAKISYPKAFLVDINYVPPVIEIPNYADEVTTGAIRAADEYKFDQKYADLTVDELTGKKVHRVIARGDNLYILARDNDEEATLVVYNTVEKAVKALVDTEGMDGTEINCSDIQLTADGVLVASVKELCQSGTDQMQASDLRRGVMKFYKWANDDKGLPTGAPEQWLTSEGFGNYYRSLSGETFAYSGTSTEGKIVFSCETWYGSGNLRSEILTIAGGVLANDEYAFPNYNAPGVFNAKILGQDYRFVTSPLNPDRYWVAGSGISEAVTEYEFHHEKNANHLAALPADVMFKGTPRMSCFKYAGHSYMVAPFVEESEENAEGQVARSCVGVKLIDVTDGLAKAKVVSTVNTGLEASGVDNIAAAGSVSVTRNSNDEVTDAAINLYLVRGDGRLTHFTTAGVEQASATGAYAYGIRHENTNEGYNLTFGITADAKAATIVLRGDGVADVEIPVADATAGIKTVSIPAESLEEGKEYDVDVKIDNAPISRVADFRNDPNGLNVNGGVVVITDPAQESFGYVVVGHGPNSGYDIYNPAGEKVATRIWKGHASMGGPKETNISNPMRGNEREGMAVFAGWGDASEGVVAIDPINTEAEPVSLYAGVKQGAGHHIYEGINVGGGTPDVAFVDEGENTLMVTFSEDHEGKNGGGATENSLVYYPIGSAWQVTTAPAVIGFKSLLANTNVGLTAYGNGVFASQVRGAGNNSEGVPGFAYISLDDKSSAKKVFSSHELTDMNACNSAFAINREGNLAAVGEPNRVLVYSVAWEDGMPAFTFEYAFPTANIGWGHMRFDYAGNLHYYQRQNGGYHVIALPSEAKTVTTPANFTLTGKPSGVENIGIDTDTDAPAVIYNLQGVRMSGDNLTPGVYIRKQGKKATKIVVR